MNNQSNKTIIQNKSTTKWEFLSFNDIQQILEHKKTLFKANQQSLSNFNSSDSLAYFQSSNIAISKIEPFKHIHTFSKALDNVSHNEYSICGIRYEKNNELLISSLSKQMSILKSLRNHMNIINYIDSIYVDEDKDVVTIIYLFEALSGISLKNIIDEIHKTNSIYNNLNLIITIMKNINSGLLAVHSIGYSLMNLSLNDIYITKNKDYKIFNFLYSVKEFSSEEYFSYIFSMNKSLIQPPEYINPDEKKEFSNKIDSFSMGIVLYKVLFNDKFILEEINENMNLIIEKYYSIIDNVNFFYNNKSIKNEVLKEVLSIILALLNIDPKIRMSMKSLEERLAKIRPGFIDNNIGIGSSSERKSIFNKVNLLEKPDNQNNLNGNNNNQINDGNHSHDHDYLNFLNKLGNTKENKEKKEKINEIENFNDPNEYIDSKVNELRNTFRSNKSNSDEEVEVEADPEADNEEEEEIAEISKKTKSKLNRFDTQGDITGCIMKIDNDDSQTPKKIINKIISINTFLFKRHSTMFWVMRLTEIKGEYDIKYLRDLIIKGYAKPSKVNKVLDSLNSQPIYEFTEVAIKGVMLLFHYLLLGNIKCLDFTKTEYLLVFLSNVWKIRLKTGKYKENDLNKSEDSSIFILKSIDLLKIKLKLFETFPKVQISNNYSIHRLLIKDTNINSKTYQSSINSIINIDFIVNLINFYKETIDFLDNLSFSSNSNTISNTYDIFIQILNEEICSIFNFLYMVFIGYKLQNLNLHQVQYDEFVQLTNRAIKVFECKIQKFRKQIKSRLVIFHIPTRFNNVYQSIDLSELGKDIYQYFFICSMINSSPTPVKSHFDVESLIQTGNFLLYDFSNINNQYGIGEILRNSCFFESSEEENKENKKKNKKNKSNEEDKPKVLTIEELFISNNNKNNDNEKKLSEKKNSINEILNMLKNQNNNNPNETTSNNKKNQTIHNSTNNKKSNNSIQIYNFTNNIQIKEENMSITQLANKILQESIIESQHHWIIKSKEIDIEKQIGFGGSSEVFLGIYRGCEVAIKKLKLYEVKEESLKEFKREISTLMLLRHPNLVLFMGAVIEPENISIVTEYCHGGTLFSLLHQRRSIDISWEFRVSILLEIAIGMNFLHTNNPFIIHRDLKSLNILLTEKIEKTGDKSKIKISDFGLSKAIYGKETLHTGNLGTCHWMPPEVIENKKYTIKADIYSFGIIIWECLSRQTPYSEMSQQQISYHVSVKKGRPDCSLIPNDAPFGLKILMEKCWDDEPSLRPSFESIVTYLRKLMMKVQS